MNKKVAIIISPNYKDYAKKYLAECVAGLRKQDYAGEMKIFIADNETSEESLALLNNIIETHGNASAQIIRNKNNDGFAKGNNDCMKLALKQGFDYVILFNMDTVVETDCVRKMVEAAEIQPPSPPLSGGKKEIGAVQARLMLYNKENLTPASPLQYGGQAYKGEGIINSLGNVTHFLGFGYAKGYLTPYSPFLIRRGESNGICYPSGAAVLFTKEALEKVGLFDEQMWLYNEDQDLGWRLWLYGYKCVLAPDAVVYHKYEFSRSIKKYYFMDRNRILAMLKNYHWGTLLLILPAFIAMEIGLLLFSFSNGWFKEKIKVYKYFLRPESWRHIMPERKKIQSARTVPDKEIIKLFSGKIWYQEIGEWKLKIANAVFDAYWQIDNVLIRW